MTQPVDMAGTPPPPEWGVAVDAAAIDALADAWASTPFEQPAFDYPGTPVHRDERWWFDYVALSVSVLACLWPPAGDDVWHAEHDGDWFDDAPGIFTAFTRRYRADGFDLRWFASMTEADGDALFAGRGTLQLIADRVETLRAAAAALQTTWDGSARNLVEEAGRDGTQIVRLLSETVPGYQDRPMTQVGPAHFDKLSHLSAAIMAAGVGWEDAGFDGYQDFPVYPDYMLPRVFRHYRAMIYTPELAAAIDARELIGADTDAEHAIRWATVHCGALLRGALRDRGATVTGPALDYRLWSIAVLGPDASLFGEHHRTLTMRY